MICPNCKKEMTRLCYPTYPPQYGYECFSCGNKVDESDSNITIVSSAKSSEDDDSPFVKYASKIVELIRSKGVVVTEEMCIHIARYCNEIFKEGLREGAQVALSQYESTLVEKLKDISSKSNGVTKVVLDALCTSIEEQGVKND